MDFINCIIPWWHLVKGQGVEKRKRVIQTQQNNKEYFSKTSPPVIIRPCSDLLIFHHSVRNHLKTYVIYVNILEGLNLPIKADTQHTEGNSFFGEPGFGRSLTCPSNLSQRKQKSVKYLHKIWMGKIRFLQYI